MFALRKKAGVIFSQQQILVVLLKCRLNRSLGILISINLIIKIKLQSEVTESVKVMKYNSNFKNLLIFKMNRIFWYYIKILLSLKQTVKKKKRQLEIVVCYNNK